MLATAKWRFTTGHGGCWSHGHSAYERSGLMNTVGERWPWLRYRRNIIGRHQWHDAELRQRYRWSAQPSLPLPRRQYYVTRHTSRVTILSRRLSGEQHTPLLWHGIWSLVITTLRCWRWSNTVIIYHHIIYWL